MFAIVDYLGEIGERKLTSTIRTKKGLKNALLAQLDDCSLSHNKKMECLIDLAVKECFT